MAYLKGGAGFARFMASIPAQLEAKVLKGAAKAAANVIAEEARTRCISPEVSAGIRTKVQSTPGQVRSTVSIKGGWPRSVANWLEYGTTDHFISVDDSQREGRSARGINRLKGEAASLKIGGQFVGTTVHVTGARPHPFLRPALDTKEAEAIAAAQSYINSRVSRAGITGSAEAEDRDE